MKFILSSDGITGAMSDSGFTQIVIVFILIIALILYGPDYIRTGILIIALSLLFFIFTGNRINPGKHSDDTGSMGEGSGESANNSDITSDTLSPSDDSAEDIQECEKSQIENPYLWMSNPEYSTCYQPVQMGYYNLPENDQSYCNMGSYMAFDEANARISALRQRDKKTLDGWATKNVNFYKKHYGRELNEAEHKRWWGNDEY